MSCFAQQPFPFLSISLSCLWPLGQFHHLEQDRQSRHHLPPEQSHPDRVGGDVQAPCRFVPLGHEGDARVRGGPEDHAGGAGVQVRAGEELAGAGVGVEGTLDGECRAQERQYGPLSVVLVPQPLTAQFLPLLRQRRDLPLQPQRPLQRLHPTQIRPSLRPLRLLHRLRDARGSHEIRHPLLQRRDFVPDGPLTTPLQPQEAGAEGQKEHRGHDHGVEEGSGPTFEDAPIGSGGEGFGGGCGPGEGRGGGGGGGPGEGRGGGIGALVEGGRVVGGEVEGIERRDDLIVEGGAERGG
mmetsp:Transcript_34421/g.70297  ORF Transcript_34421/g.70297 Transcript_34421/m.70297 type:complete len:296 (+) Transcript_34421:220-1107(+)